MADELPDVVPMIAYANGPRALEWLADAFGFTERVRITDAEGRLAHGEMQAGRGVIMLATPSPHYQGPARHRETCQQARAWSAVPYIVDGALVQVDDVAAHCERSRRAGASILSEPESDEHGTRYRAEDCEGHRWMFVQR